MKAKNGTPLVQAHLNKDLYTYLKERARVNCRNMAQELRAILTEVMAKDDNDYQLR